MEDPQTGVELKEKISEVVGNESESKGRLICYHCGDTCPDDTISIGDKLFCCNGCKTVFEILDTSDMCNYYDIENNPGITLKGRRQVHYSWLDDADVREKLISFEDEKHTKVSFYLPQIHCSACVWLLENLYRLADGIISSRVNFLEKQVFIQYENDKFTLRSLVELLDSIGYAPAISMSDLDEKKPKQFERRFYYRLGFAGFAFGNIMLLSFPEYLGLDKGVDYTFFRFFGFINIILSIPVVFFSGIDYLRSAWVSIRQKNLNIDVPISLGILSIFSWSLYEILSGTGAGYMDSLTGLIFFLLIGRWFQQKTYSTIEFERDYKSYFPIAATIVSDGVESTIVVDKLKPGDTIVVRNHELVPADGLLLKGKGQIDYSFVTGESEKISVMPGQKVFAGGRQYGDSMQLTLTKKVSQSYLTQLWNDAAFKKEEKLRASELADKIGTYFTYVILVIAFLTLIFWLIFDPSKAIFAFSAILVVACPCAAALSIPFTLGNVLRILSRRQFFLKNTGVIESIDRITHVVFDKTGTLTYSGQSEVGFEGKIEDESDWSVIRSLAHQSNHPMSRMIDHHIDAPYVEVGSFEEIAGSGVSCMYNGRKYKIGNAAFTGSKSAVKGVHVAIDDQAVGVFAVNNTYREGINDFLRYFGAHYRISLISGDNDKERAQLEALFPAGTNLLFNQSPADKLEYIRKLQEEKGENVLFFGDGLNDAGAIQKSNVGIVLTEDVNNFTPASDGIISSIKFGMIPKFIEYSKRSLRLVFWAYAIAFIYNTIGVSIAATGNLSPLIAAILMPVSSVSVVLFGVLTSSVLAGRIGLGKKDHSGD